MGNRANFVIVKDQDWRLFYSHWAGCRMLDALIGGPELALRYAHSLRESAKDEWVDPLWADGGAVVDLDRRRLLFFGDELMVGMQERRALMRVLAAVWAGYAVGWAYDGTVELAEYLGAEVRHPEMRTLPDLTLAHDRNALCHLVSVSDAAGQVRMWPLWHFDQALHGPALLDKLPGPGARALTLGAIPQGGLHIDASRKILGAWQTTDAMGVFQNLADLWNGWRTETWEDRFEEQALRCKGALRIPELDLIAGADAARAWIRKRAFQGLADSPPGQIAKLAMLLDPVAPGLVVSDDALDEGAVRPRKAEWGRFVRACDELRTDREKSA